MAHITFQHPKGGTTPVTVLRGKRKVGFIRYDKALKCWRVDRAIATFASIHEDDPLVTGVTDMEYLQKRLRWRAQVV